MAFEILDDIDFEAKPREYKGGAKGPRPRTEEQKPWDEAFDNAWKSENKVLAAQVTPDMAEDAKKHVLSSARFYGLAVTEGKAIPGKVEGTVILRWKIREPKKRVASRTDVNTSDE